MNGRSGKVANGRSWKVANGRPLVAAGVLTVLALGAAAVTWPAAAQGPGATPVLRRADPRLTLVVPAQVTSTLAPPSATATTAAPPIPTGGAPTPSPEVGYPQEERPLIVVASFKVDPGRPAVGAEFSLEVVVANRGERFAENVTLSLGGEAFLAADQGSQMYWNSVDEGEEESGSIRMRSAAGLAAGVYPLQVAMRWDDSDGNTFNDATSVGIALGDGPSRPVISVTGSRLPSRVAPGVPFQVALDVVNTGGQEARNLVASTLAGPLSAVGSGGTGPINLPPGGSGTLVLVLMASEPTQPGATSQSIELRYDGPGGDRFVESHNIGVQISAEAAFGPLPMVAAYRVGDGTEDESDTLAPGQVFDLSIDVQNVGATAALRTRMSLGSSSGAAAGAAAGASSGPFAPVGTGSTRFLATLPAGGTTTVEQRMVVAGDAKPGVYTVSVAFSFVDADGQEHETSELITLLVARSISVTIHAVDVITQTTVGESVSFSAEIVNAGGGTVNVGDVEVVGSRSMGVEDGRRFVGPLDAGALDVIEATLTPKAPGSATVTVKVHYTDDFNQARTLEQEFVFTVDAASAEVPVEEIEARQTGSTSVAVRVVKGLLGLGASGPPEPELPPDPDGAVVEPSSGD